jgi:probable rRNA maturation factor
LQLRSRERTVACLRLLAELTGWAATLPPDAELQVEFAGRRRMARWNRQFLGHAGATDVLAFPRPATGLPPDPDAGGILAGELAVCPAVAETAAARYGTTPAEELLLYLVHGLLHLAGEDDHTPAGKRRMRRREQRLLVQLRSAGFTGEALFAFRQPPPTPPGR